MTPPFILLGETIASEYRQELCLCIPLHVTRTSMNRNAITMNYVKPARKFGGGGDIILFNLRKMYFFTIQNGDSDGSKMDQRIYFHMITYVLV